MTDIITRLAVEVSYAHPDGYAIFQALIDRGVIGDFRDRALVT